MTYAPHTFRIDMTFSEFITSPATLAPLIVGSIFLSLGLNFILHYYRFRARSTTIRGTVRAIEKYTSFSVGNNNPSRQQVYYRPIVEYRHNSQNCTTYGASVNEIRHSLGQEVRVLLNSSDDKTQTQAIIDDNINILMGAIFACAGAVALYVYVFGVGGHATVALVTASTVFGLGYFISTMMLNFKGSAIGIESHEGPRANSVMIETKADFVKEVSSHGFWGNIISFAFMLLSGVMMYYGYNQIPGEALSLMQNDFSAFWERLTDGDIPEQWKESLLVSGMGTFFFLASLRSIYYVRKKYGGLTKM